MAETYYRTGQAAKLLGVSSYHVRRLCESGIIEAELTSGQQWQVSSAEVNRLKREGVPPVPAMIRDEDDDSNTGQAETDVETDDDYPEPSLPSGRVSEAADDVRVAASRLQRRRLERESEEVEDWFRDRDRREAAERTAEQQKNEAAQRELKRRLWLQQWTKYALDLVPREAPREVELDVHTCVQSALASLRSDGDTAVTKRLVSAAVEKALRPWRRRQTIIAAIDDSMRRLPYEVRYRAEFADLKQRAQESIAAALNRAGEDASATDLGATAMQAARPVLSEYEHRQACERMASGVYLSGASFEELQEAQRLVRMAFRTLSIGASPDQFEKAKVVALQSLSTSIAKRKEAERLESEKRHAEWRADLELSYVAEYLAREYEFDGGHRELIEEAERLRPLVKKTIAKEIMLRPALDTTAIRKMIERTVDEES